MGQSLTTQRERTKLSGAPTKEEEGARRRLRRSRRSVVGCFDGGGGYDGGRGVLSALWRRRGAVGAAAEEERATRRRKERERERPLKSPPEIPLARKPLAGGKRRRRSPFVDGERNATASIRFPNGGVSGLCARGGGV
ncbi:hypothetical protein BHM03_00024029 [Ensete ventricosum]|nr:hypothetical protein BHM03_00024029 [Ensete ventricosum]